MLLFRLLLLLIFSVLLVEVNGQIFRHFPEHEGGPQTAVMNVAQDQQGFIWMATASGLFKYDSRTFKAYPPDPENPRALSSEYIYSVFCDSRGNLWVGTWNGLSLYDRKGDCFTNFRHRPHDPNSISSDTIYCFTEDSQKRIWVGTSNGLNRITKTGDQIKFDRYLDNKLPKPSRDIQCIGIGNNDDLWMGTLDGLVFMSGSTGQFTLYRSEPDSRVNAINEFASIYPDKAGNVWLGIRNGGLLRFDIASKKFHLHDRFKEPSGNFPMISGFVEDKNGKFWISTWSGLIHFDPSNDHIQRFTNQHNNPHSLPDNDLTSIYKDRQGGLWLGGYYQGVIYMDPDAPQFSQWPFFLDNTKEHQFVNGWAGISKKGKPWLMAEDRSEIILYDRKTKLKSYVKLNLPASALYDFFLVDENDILWAGGTGVLSSLDLKSRKHQDYPLPLPATISSGRKRIRRMLEDRSGKLLIGGTFGLLRFDPNKKTFEKIISDKSIISIFEDSKTNLWCATKNKVLLLKKGVLPIKSFDVERTTSVKNTTSLDVWRVTEDASGRIWTPTLEGLRLYNAKLGRFVAYPQKGHKLLKDFVDIQSDRQGYLWLSAEAKLIRYHPVKGSIQAYGERDGLPSNASLRVDGAFNDSDGNLYFPTNKGMFSFNPDEVIVNTRPSPVAISALKLFNQEVQVGDKTKLLQWEINEEKELVFQHDQNVFSLDFALLSYKRSDKNQYRYKLEGFEKQWNDVKIPSSTYTNLPPGKYTFLANASNGDGFWNKEPLRLKITILPPWWKTWYAYLFYITMIGLAIYSVTRFFWLRSSFRKENELYQAKLNFFTNVSHEIRTHLTLIDGPLQKASQSGSVDAETEVNLARAKSNSGRLMTLVNELLDFRKIQNGNVRLYVGEYDIVKVLKHSLAAFEHIAAEKDIHTNLQYPSDTPVILYFDSTQIQKVFNNLLSNAYKFTPEGGNIVVVLKEISNEVIIDVVNSGSGIPGEYLTRLFNNFFQVYEGNNNNTGYGIGLALSREIVNQHHGDLSVTSRVATQTRTGETCFTLRFLTGKRHFDAKQLSTPAMLSYTRSDNQNEIAVSPKYNTDDLTKRTILLIEDNEELRAFTKETLRDKFYILEADNGDSGTKIAKEHLPDLILCDIMMPGSDGLKVCQQLKSDILTSHIPIIFLTARSTIPQMIEGLETGADDYLIKPFDFRVLELKINNLINFKETLKHQYGRFLSLEPNDLVIKDLDSEFIAKLRGIVIANIADPDFGVNQMAFQIGISVSVLYRKVRSLTGITVNDFMKSIRLKSALQLLESGMYNVSEVATSVGFEDSKYFSKEFRKVYGKTPTEVRKQSTTTKDDTL